MRNRKNLLPVVVGVVLLAWVSAGLWGWQHWHQAASLRMANRSAERLPDAEPAETRPRVIGDGDSVAQARVSEAFGQIPMSFETNTGQTAPQVRFMARGNGYSLFLTANEAVLTLNKPKENPKNQPAVGGRSGELPLAKRKPLEREMAVLRMRLQGSKADPQIAGEVPLPVKTNYFIGNNPGQWRTDVASFSKVRYREVYPGIDLVYYGNQSKLEYDFVVSPGADPTLIGLNFEGADEIGVNEEGELVLKTPGGEVRQHRPLVYQEVKGSRRLIEATYRRIGEGQVGFQVAHYDASQPLVIDPVLSYSTYFGGNISDRGFGIAVDKSGNTYVAGETNSTTFPVTNAYQAVKGGGTDAFVLKLNPLGNAVIYATYLGGSALDRAFGIAVDASGNSYVTGETSSGNFPIANAIQSSYGGGTDAFVAKLSPSGNSLAYSTYLGGNGYEIGSGIAADPFGNVCTTGTTNSMTGFPLVNAFQSTFGGNFDAFVTKLNPAGSSLVYSTYLGGGSLDQGFGVALDSYGNAHVTGETSSAGFPKVNALQATLGGTDAFVTKFSPNGNALVYSTYLGGSSLERGAGIAVDSLGNAYVTGETQSSNFPTANPIQATYGGTIDAFATKLNSSGSLMIFSTFLGGNDVDQGFAISVDTSGNAFLFGETRSANFPVVNALQSAWAGGTDDFVTKISPNGSSLVYSTYLGGSSFDQAGGIGVDASGNAHVAGRTSSTDFPVSSSLQPILNGSDDAIIAKVSPNNTCSSPSFDTPVDLQASAGSSSSVAGDVNSDGKLDLAVTNTSSNDISVFLGDGVGGFAPTATFPVGLEPYHVAMSDFNVDGKPDLAVANSGSNNVSILLGDGGGGFGVPNNFATGFFPQFVAVGDFNTDGRADLAVRNQNSHDVSILLGDGIGGFSTTPSLGVGGDGGYVVMADFNGDGKADLAIANGNNNNISILLGNGAGGFGAPSNFQVNSTPYSLAVADFNRDGRPDLVVGRVNSTSISLLLGDGIGGFSTASNFVVGANSISLAVGDFNSDGKPDLAVGNNSFNSPLNTIPVLLGDGTGGFGTAGKFTANSNPFFVVTGDFNGDGKPDLAATNFSNNVAILRNNCSPPQDPIISLSLMTLSFAERIVGTTSSPEVLNLSNTGGSPLEITSIAASGDFTQASNCAPSVAAGGNCSISVSFTPTALGLRTGSLTIVDNAAGSPHIVNLTGSGLLPPAPIVSVSPNNLSFDDVPVGGAGFAQTVVINNTGNAPLVVSSVSITSDFAIQSNGCVFGADPFDSCFIRVRFQPTAAGNRTGSLSIADNAAGSPRTVALSGTGTSAPLLFGNPSSFSSAPFPYNLISADFNGDGKPDLATTAGLRVHFGNGDGSFQAGASYPPRGDQIAVGDFNVDGWTDMALSSEGSGSASIYLNNQNGTFQPPVHYPVGMPPRALAVADFNDDIYPDLVVASFNCCMHKLTVFLGNGTGSLQTGQDISLPGSLPTALGVGDFNRDGRRDLVVSNYGSGNVTIFLGNGNGTFQSPQNYGVNSAPNRPNNLVVSDFDRDGKEDLAVSCQDVSGVVSVLRGNGDGTFLPAVTYSTGPNAARLATGDFNNDAMVDLAVSTDQGAAVLLGNGDGSFQSPALYGIGIGGAALVAGDFSRDGLHDLAGVKSNDGNLYTLLNNGNGLRSGLLAWGHNESGQLGNGTTLSTTTPVRALGLTGVKGLSSGGAAAGHTLAVKSDGTLCAWGHNASGQLGNGTTTSSSSPIQVAGINGAKGVAAGVNHSLTLRSDGTVWAWGFNSGGQLGNGTTTGSTIPVQVIGLSGVKAIAAGDSHGLAVKFDGTVWAWGSNTLGQLGNGTTTGSTTPVQVSGVSGVVAIAAGGAHSLAVKSDGTVWAWGYNGSGQLGNGTGTDALTPIQTTALSNISKVACGNSHSLALASDGTVRAWGFNFYGQLGNGATANSTTPTQVSGLTGVTSLAGGRFHSLALRSDGTLRAWGYNEVGQLGNGSTVNSSVPLQVTGVVGATVIAGRMDHQSVALALSPFVSANPGNVTFSDQLVGTNSATQTITVNNNGPVSFSMGQAVLMGTNPGDFSVTFNSCTGNLIPSGGACNVMVRFAPTGRGARTAILRFYDNAFDSPQTVSLTGTGLAPDVGFSATSLTFAPVLVGTSSTAQTITVTNTGTAPLTISSVTVSPFFFVSANSCSGSLAPGQTCNTSVFFNPSSRGDFAGNLNYFSNASGSPHQIALYGTALAVTTTTITSSANPVVEGTSVTLTVNVSSGFGVPTGSIQLFDFASSVATVPLTAGAATYTLTPTVGSHAYAAAYQPVGFFVASTSAVLQQVITAPTPTGSNVSTTTTVETSTITPTFPSVTSAGQTTVAPIEPSSAGTVPGGYSISGSSLAFEISTTATLGGIDPNDPATWIVIRFDVPSITDPLAFANLRVLHNESGVLVDRTILSGPSAPDFPNKRIYARVPSLSPFVLSQVTGTTIPQVTGPLNPLALGATATVVAQFTDVASQTSHTCTFSWDDATANTTVTAATGASGSCSASHIYSQAGVYTATVTVSNGSGGVANSTFQYVVVFDPSGGFVTGGGWITSPAGAYVSSPSLTGKATFGFVSKYEKGANMPTGQTEFQFHVASFSFQSTVYEWLVIAGSRAQYKGSGTVNGSGNYGFLLTAVDGQENGGGGFDKFRIKIWDKNNNAIAYDNQIGSTDNADLTTPGTLLGGGSVVIHK